MLKIEFNLIHFLRIPGNKSRYNTEEKPAGFFDGFWHGLISYITLLFSYYSKNVSMFEKNNNGFHYEFGFLCGFSFYNFIINKAYSFYI